jgi:hypothetical protein
MSSSALKKPVYLRGIPSEIVREAKAIAARRGITLAGFVADTLARAVREPEENAAASSTSDQDDALTQEMRWYERNRERLTRDYSGQYVAVLDGALLDHDRDFEQLAERVFARAGSRSVFMPRVAEPTRAQAPLRVRSPRVVRSPRAATR